MNLISFGDGYIVRRLAVGDKNTALDDSDVF